MKLKMWNCCMIGAVLLLSGCASSTPNENAGYGAAAGVAIGALASNPLLAVIGGAAGMVIGHNFGEEQENAIYTTTS